MAEVLYTDGHRFTYDPNKIPFDNVDEAWQMYHLALFGPTPTDGHNCQERGEGFGDGYEVGYALGRRDGEQQRQEETPPPSPT